MKSRSQKALQGYILLLLTFIFLFSSSAELRSQQNENMDFTEASEIIIKGIVYNEFTKEPIPFVNMIIRNTLAGTATDEEGRFTLTFPEEYINNNLFVSVIGFSSKNFKLSDLQKVENVIIELIPTNYEIVSINIEAESKVLYGHVRKTIDSLSKNYINVPFEYNFEYKNKYIAGASSNTTDSKGVITDKTGYRTQSKTSLFSSRSFKFSETERDFKEKPFKNGLSYMNELLTYDVIRSQSSIFAAENLYQYQLELIDSEPYDDDTLLHIAFKNLSPDLNTTQDAYIKYYEGELFLLKNKNVLVKCIIHGSSTKKSIHGKTFYVKGNQDLLGEDVQYTATISYRNQGNTFHLSSINLIESFVTANKLKGKSVTQLTIPDYRILKSAPKIKTRDYFNNPDGY